MLINILLPGSAKFPIGGFKILFEYANGLAKKGYKINVVIPLVLSLSNLSELKKIKLMAIYNRDKLLNNYSPKSWFKLDEKINQEWVLSLDEKNIPKGDVLIASSWHTAKIANFYNFDKGRKIYFIQSFESWHGKHEEVLDTWKMPFKKIVISKWLKEFADLINEEAVYIPNGLDFFSFGIDILPEERNPKSIGMLFHDLEVKGSIFGIEAFILLKKEIPDIDVTLFGVVDKPKLIPEWIKYFKNPSQKVLRKLYNDTAIFVSPSLMEGFPLTPAEALICGCAIVLSEIGGHMEYSENEKTALLFPSKDTNKLKECIIRLIYNNNFRLNLAYEGNKNIKKYQWEDSINQFEKVLKEFQN